MAFHLLGLSPNNLLRGSRIQEFGALVQLAISATESATPKYQLYGDKILHIINSARLEDMPVRDYMLKHRIEDISVRYVEDIDKRYLDYKQLNCLYDYTDMLVMTKQTDIETPHLEYMFIDEAQDLSRLSWMLVDKMAATTKNIIIAGDDKQCIARHAAADVETFLHLPGKVEVLEQSYRVPRCVFYVANNIVNHMHSYRKEGAVWKPRDFSGVCKEVGSLPTVPLFSKTWLLLVRSKHQSSLYTEHIFYLSKYGSIPFTLFGEPPVDMDIFRVAALFEKSKRTGLDLVEFVTLKSTDSPDQIKEKYEYITLFKKFITCKVGARSQPWEVTQEFKDTLSNKHWLEALDKVPSNVRMYVKGLMPQYYEKGDALFDNAPIRVTTIHQSKGSEADNVVVLMNVPKKVKENILNNYDDEEAKVFYVAVTRAKEKLYLFIKRTESCTFKKYL